MHIHYITNTRQGLKIGERNQALGVVDALRERFQDAIILEHDVSDVGRIEAIIERYSGQHIVIGVSDAGVQAFSQLPKPMRHIAVLIGHEVPDGLESVQDKITVLAVPAYDQRCPETFGKAIIVRTDGVANTMTKEKADLAYQDWKNRFTFAPDQPVIAVMLGGKVDGRNMQRGETAKMAEYVAQQAKASGAYVIATNSPRSAISDTQEFLSVLYGSGCGMLFFPFHMKNQNNETPYRAMVGAVASSPHNRIVVSGDSVSMPCEIARVVEPSQLFLYRVSNMNPQNMAFMEWMRDTGRAGIIESSGDGFTEWPYAMVAASRTMDAGRRIAHAVAEIAVSQ
ncbi:MAG TPA: ELM1/GtrOC1 family putative glycosyltransferase [Rickettsiales bacterium]|nr:ELM1/GtrOC1 family putative glycosyltransferase [Rickettsiales bacterium]